MARKSCVLKKEKERKEEEERRGEGKRRHKRLVVKIEDATSPLPLSNYGYDRPLYNLLLSGDTGNAIGMS